MKTTKFSNEADWLKARIGKVTGSKLKDIVVKRGTEKKIGSYQLIADKLGIPADDEKPIDRGHRLEKEAISQFVKETGKKVDDSLYLWTREDNENIAYSPDGVISKTETLEIKCLGSAKHIQAFIENKIPDEFEFQKLQSFIVNDKQKTLYFAFYDPRLLAKPFFYFKIDRKDIKEDIKKYKEYQENELVWVNEWVKKLSNF